MCAPEPSGHAAPKAPTVKEAYDIFASQIVKEDALVASRMSWALTVHGGILTVYAGLYTLLSSNLLEIESWWKTIILISAGVCFMAIAYDIYKNAIEAIFDARLQMYRIQAVYQQHWKDEFERHSLPAFYGSGKAAGAYSDGPPKFHTWPVISVRPSLPFAKRLHGVQIGKCRFVHHELDTSSLRHRRWYAEHILSASLAVWFVLLIMAIMGALLTHYGEHGQGRAIRVVQQETVEPKLR